VSRTPAIVFALTTVFALITAIGATSTLRYVVKPEGEVADPEVAVADAGTTGRRAVSPRALSADQYLDVILGQNLFDEAERARWAALKNAPKAGTSPGAGAPTEIDVRLLGTVVADNPAYSSALIIEDGKDHAYGYGVGDDLLGREVVAIEPKKVTLKFGTELEYLVMDEEETPVRTTRSTSSSNDDDGIEDLGDGKYALPRELFDKYVTDLESVQKMGRALLHRGPDGNYDGYRLSAIRRGSLPDKLGIKNGDVIHSVNGTSLDSMQNAMGAYQTMQSENNFCLEVTRRGSPQTLCYELQ
jgi:general secretion pathway protein C